jgi:hypothetical protein
MTLRTWSKILPYFIIEWVIRRDQSNWVWLLKKSPYTYWNNDESIGADEIERYHVYEFTKDCKLIVTDKDIISRQIEKKERELRKLKSELEEI